MKTLRITVAVIVTVVSLFTLWHVADAQELEPRCYLPAVYADYEPTQVWVILSQAVAEIEMPITSLLVASNVRDVDRMQGAIRFESPLSGRNLIYGNLWGVLDAVRKTPEWYINAVVFEQIGIVPTSAEEAVLVQFDFWAHEPKPSGAELGYAVALDSDIFTVIETVYIVPCLGDYTGDGARNVWDQIAFYNHIGKLYDPLYDINGDGAVTMGDYEMLDDLWYKDCP